MLDHRSLQSPCSDMEADAALIKALEDSASEILTPQAISDVIIERRCEYNDDVVYNVDVILASTSDKLNVHRAERLIARYFALVAKHEPGSMPVVSFIDQADMKNCDADSR